MTVLPCLSQSVPDYKKPKLSVNRRGADLLKPRQMAEFTNAIQRYVMEKTRLGIPVMFYEESLHGHMASGGTHFSQAIALASSWDPKLVEEVYSAVAREVRSASRQVTHHRLCANTHMGGMTRFSTTVVFFYVSPAPIIVST